uniref:RxLR effector candidate protein n=1 Tax=Hyaloperonospora arabidopsidis (strain Emoy2) TaxID=559515 RepID=M4BE91_HYAAE
MLEEAREQLRAHHVRIFESEKTREKMKTFELHPDRLFTMLVGAGERPGVKGGHLTKTFVSQNLDFMDAYIKGYNWRHHTKYTLLGTFKRCIDDPAELASFLSIAKRNSVYGLPAKRMQQELFAEWQYDSMTIDQIVGMMWRPAEITGVFAYQFLDTLIGYTSFCNMNQPDLQVFTVRLLRKHLGDSQLYMLTERAKEEVLLMPMPRIRLHRGVPRSTLRMLHAPVRNARFSSRKAL